MAVAQQNIGPAVVIEVEKRRAPAEKTRVAAETSLKRRVVEGVVAEIVIEAGSVAGEIRLDDVEASVAVIIGRRDAHAGLRFAVRPVGHAGFGCNFGECAVVIVLVEGGGGRIVGYVDVGPAIVVEIGGQHAEAVSAGRFQYAGFRRNIREGSIAVIVEQNIFAAIETRWATRDFQSFIETRAAFRRRDGLDVEIDVVGDEQVEMAVTVVVEEGAAGIPARELTASGSDARMFGNVGEGAVAVVAEERAVAPIRDEKIVMAIVVVVADAAALPP